MQVSTANDVRIYNLSHGKSIPEWISSKKRKEIGRKDVDVRRRIQLIQEFEMPDVSTSISITPDGRYVFVGGMYKPVVKCFDLQDLSMKYSRCSDNEIKKILTLGTDYQKYLLLTDERWIEMHTAFGRYYRLRVPRTGRDMSFSKEISELFVACTGSEVYRLNLEQGEFLQPFELEADAANCCTVAEWHQLLAVGTTQGTVECWDHRDRSRVGHLNVMMALNDEIDFVPQVTTIKFRDPLHFGVGTNWGHVVLYDIRSSRPLLVKNMQNELPVVQMEFVNREDTDVVLSMDTRALKIWDEKTGRPITAVEPEVPLTDFVRYEDSGMIFIANEAPKILQYFIPLLGNAPRWCSFLEAITEELEENDKPEVYDDYKFVTEQQLEDIGLRHLIGTPMLRAYMHGYFIDVRLFNKAQTLTQPFAYDKYKQRKIRDAIEDERDAAKVGVKKIIKEKGPKVNKELAARLEYQARVASKTGKNKQKKVENAETASSILQDSRFAKLFESEEFQVDETSESFLKAEARMRKALKLQPQEDAENEAFSEQESEEEMGPQSEFLLQEEAVEHNKLSDEDFMGVTSESEASVDEKEEIEKNERMKLAKQRKRERHRRIKEELALELDAKKAARPTKFKLHELDVGENTTKFMDGAEDNVKKNIVMKDRRIKLDKEGGYLEVEDSEFGGKSITFELKKGSKNAREEQAKLKSEKHLAERKEVRRAASKLSKSLDRKLFVRRAGKKL